MKQGHIDKYIKVIEKYGFKVVEIDETMKVDIKEGNELYTQMTGKPGNVDMAVYATNGKDSEEDFVSVSVNTTNHWLMTGDYGPISFGIGSGGLDKAMGMLSQITELRVKMREDPDNFDQDTVLELFERLKAEVRQQAELN